MRLIGVTKLVDQSCLIGLIEENARHFDHLMVISVPDDIYFERRLRRNGTPCTVALLPLISPQSLDADGVSFSDLARHLPVGLESPADDCWFLFFDPGTLLSPSFRSWIESVQDQLEPGYVYGPEKRRRCSTEAEFAAIFSQKNWESGSSSHQGTVGGFRLFHSKHGPSLRFTRFDDPISVHSGRQPIQGGLPLKELATTVLEFEPHETFKGDADECVNLTTSSDRRSLTSIFDVLTTIRSKDPDLVGLLIGNKAFLPGISRDQLKAFGIQKTIQLPLESTSTRDSEPAEGWVVGISRVWKELSPNFVILAGEQTSSVLLALIPQLMRLVNWDTWICGCGYGFPAFPVSTNIIELSLGTPLIVADDGTWACLLKASEQAELDWPCAPPICKSPREIDGSLNALEGFILFTPTANDTRATIDALGNCRELWQGPICVVTFRFDDDTLRLAAARFGASFRILDDRKERRTLENVALEEGAFESGKLCPFCVRSCAWIFLMESTPFDKTFLQVVSPKVYDVPDILNSITIDGGIRANEGGAADFIDAVSFHRRNPVIPECSRRSREWFRGEQRSLAYNCNALIRANSTADLKSMSRDRLRASRRPGDWLRTFAVRPILPAQIPIVMACDVADLSDLWESWRYVDWGARPVIVLLPAHVNGISDEHIPGTVTVVRGEFGEAPALNAIETAIRLTQGKWVAYIAPFLLPRAGAKLWHNVPDDNVAYVTSGYRFQRLPEGKCSSIPKLGAPATLVNTRWFRAAHCTYVERCHREQSDREFESFALENARGNDLKILNFDPFANGWTS